MTSPVKFFTRWGLTGSGRRGGLAMIVTFPTTMDKHAPQSPPPPAAAKRTQARRGTAWAGPTPGLSANAGNHQAGLAMTIPGVFAACMVVGLFLGRWLDSLAGTSPLFLLLGLALGLGTSVRETIRLVKRIEVSASREAGQVSSIPTGKDGPK